MRREPDHAGPGRLGPDRLTLGYDVDQNAIRFSNYLHVLRELVHLSAGWLALAPEFEVKYALGDHLHDDARAISKIRRRLYELRHPSDYPGVPAEELTELLDRLDQAPTPTEYLELAYGEAKPALIRAFRVHLETLDPVSDEPSLRLLSKRVTLRRWGAPRGRPASPRSTTSAPFRSASRISRERCGSCRPWSSPPA